MDNITVSETEGQGERTPEPPNDRPFRRQMIAFTVCRSGRYGAGWPGCWARSWHAWRTGTPARVAAARMWATAANSAYCQKSPVCHQATSSSRSGPAIEGCCSQHCVLELLVCRPRKVHSRRNCSRSPSKATGSARLALTSRVRQHPGGGIPRRGRCCFAGAGARARSPARGCQRRGRARQAGRGGRSRCQNRRSPAAARRTR